MVNYSLIYGNKGMKSVGLSFRIPYYTQWGQSLLVCGSEPVLGSWNVKTGLLLSPHNQGDELIWCGSMGVPAGFGCEYNYYVVDDDRNVLRWEAGKKRKLVLPDGLQDGEVVELHDLWQLPHCEVVVSVNFFVVEFVTRMVPTASLSEVHSKMSSFAILGALISRNPLGSFKISWTRKVQS